MEYAAYREKRHFAELDGLRALCILAVVSTHMRDRLWSWFAGYLGVVVFFVLSGFLITTLALREEDRNGRVSLRAFFVRRVFRLFPAYYLVLGVYAVLIVGLGVTPEKRTPFLAAMPYYLSYSWDIPYLATLGTGSGEAIHPYSQTWSLGVEEKFYLLWPLIAFVLLARYRRARLPVAISGIVICSVAPLITHGGVFIGPYAAIFAGCAVALLMHERSTYNRLEVLGTKPMVALSGLLVLACQLATPHVPYARLLYPFLVALLLIALVQTPTARLSVGLSRPWMVRLGELSYGIYLIHLIALNAATRIGARLVPESFGRWPAGVVEYALTVALSTAAAAMMYSYVEAPLRNRGRRIAARITAETRDEAPQPLAA